MRINFNILLNEKERALINEVSNIRNLKYHLKWNVVPLLDGLESIQVTAEWKKLQMQVYMYKDDKFIQVNVYAVKDLRKFFD